MPLATKAIKQKIKSVGNIKKITKTMEMVSVSKMRKSVDKAVSSRPYSRHALELLVNLSKDRDISHPLMMAGKSDLPAQAGKELVIIVTSNKGLCGGYHTNIFKALNAYLKKEPTNKNIQAVTIGKYAEKICKKLDIPTFASFITFSENSTFEQVKELSDLVSKEYIDGGYKSAKILYTEFLKSTSYKPVLRQLFPINVESAQNILEAKENKGEKSEEKSLMIDFTDFVFEPNVNEILESILPGLVDSVIYQSLAEAYASEHSARMFAMKNAGDNATTILHSLMLSYNHARQDGITRELSEIVAGAEALSTN